YSPEFVPSAVASCRSAKALQSGQSWQRHPIRSRAAWNSARDSITGLAVVIASVGFRPAVDFDRRTESVSIGNSADELYSSNKTGVPRRFFVPEYWEQRIWDPQAQGLPSTPQGRHPGRWRHGW